MAPAMKPAICWRTSMEKDRRRCPVTYNSRIRHAAKGVDLPKQDSIAPNIRLGGEPLKIPHQTKGLHKAAQKATDNGNMLSVQVQISGV